MPRKRKSISNGKNNSHFQEEEDCKGKESRDPFPGGKGREGESFLLGNIKKGGGGIEKKKKKKKKTPPAPKREKKKKNRLWE